MIKYVLFLFAITLLFISCSSESKKNESETSGKTVTEIGGNEIPIIALEEFEAKAGNCVDKTIQITGIVDHICKHGGKRLLLVVDGADIHIDGDERFDENLMGQEITVTGIVSEFRVDEGYCLKMEEDNINSHSEGKSDQETYEGNMAEIKEYRDLMKTNNTDHISFYSLDYVSHIVIE